MRAQSHFPGTENHSLCRIQLRYVSLFQPIKISVILFTFLGELFAKFHLAESIVLILSSFAVYGKIHRYRAFPIEECAKQKLVRSIVFPRFVSVVSSRMRLQFALSITALYLRNRHWNRITMAPCSLRQFIVGRGNIR